MAFKQHLVKLPTQAIKWACLNSHERTLCFYARLKRFHVSGAIIEPFKRYKEFNMGLSRRTYYRRLNTLIELRWAKWDGNNLILAGIDSLPLTQCNKEEKTKYFYLPNDKSLDYDTLRVVLLTLSERGQKAMIRKHPENKSQTVFKKCGDGNLIQVNSPLQKDVNMSTRTYAQVIGKKSHITAWRTYVRAQGKRLIHLTRRYIINPNANHSCYLLGVKMQKLSLEFQTRFNMNLKNLITNTLSIEERVVRSYCNDCFD